MGEPDPRDFIQALGKAVVDQWARLPRDVQECLFERAVVLGHKTEKDEALREQLARFLHDENERTAPQA